MKVVQFSPSDSPELPVKSNFLLGRIVRSQTVFSIREIECYLLCIQNVKKRMKQSSSVLSVAGRQLKLKETDMKKKPNKTQTDDMLPEYDLNGKKGVRGKYSKALQKGYSVRVLNEDGTVTIRDFVPEENMVLLDPDVKAYFPDSESVNHALRSLINLIPRKRANRVAENRGKYSKKS